MLLAYCYHRVPLSQSFVQHICCVECVCVVKTSTPEGYHEKRGTHLHKIKAHRNQCHAQQQIHGAQDELHFDAANVLLVGVHYLLWQEREDKNI